MMFVFTTLIGILASIQTTEADACNQTFQLTKGYPDFDIISLPSNLTTPTTCYIELDCAKGSTVVAKVTALQLGGVTDTVIVYDGKADSGSTAAVYRMKSTVGDVLVSSSNIMTLKIILDKTNATRNLTLQAYPQLDGGRFYTNGTFYINGSVHNNSNVQYYQLMAAPNMQVQLKLQDSLMFPAETLEVYDGDQPSLDSLLIKFMTGTSFIPVTGSQGKLLLVAKNFTSLEFLNGSFSSVPAGCDQIVTGPTGSFQLDREFIKTKCSVVLNPHLNGNFTPNSLLKMNFYDGLSICQNETLTIYEGKSVYGKRLATVTYKTQNTRLPSFYAKAENGIRLEFDSINANCSDQESGFTFQGSYWTVSACGNLITSSKATLMSPGYSNDYPLNSHCEWPIPTAENITRNMTLYMALDDLNLAQGHSVALKLNNGTVLKKFQGEALPDLDLVATVMNSTSLHYPVIVFDASPFMAGAGVNNTLRGFKARYSLIDCGGEVTATSGSFSAPKSTNQSTCLWIINLPKQGANNSVNIITFNFTAVGLKNTTVGIEIRDGGTSRSPLLQLQGRSDKSASSYLSNTNLLWVQYTGTFQFTMHYSLYNCDTKHQCKNGRCLHPDWRCDGIDQCGDMTDETNCSPSSGGNKGSGSGVKVYLVAIIGVLCFMFGVILTIVGPALYKRIRYPNYRHLQDLMEPTVT